MAQHACGNRQFPRDVAIQAASIIFAHDAIARLRPRRTEMLAELETAKFPGPTRLKMAATKAARVVCLMMTNEHAEEISRMRVRPAVAAACRFDWNGRGLNSQEQWL